MKQTVVVEKAVAKKEDISNSLLASKPSNDESSHEEAVMGHQAKKVCRKPLQGKELSDSVNISMAKTVVMPVAKEVVIETVPNADVTVQTAVLIPNSEIRKTELELLKKKYPARRSSGH